MKAKKTFVSLLSSFDPLSLCLFIFGCLFLWFCWLPLSFFCLGVSLSLSSCFFLNSCLFLPRRLCILVFRCLCLCLSVFLTSFVPLPLSLSFCLSAPLPPSVSVCLCLPCARFRLLKSKVWGLGFKV